MDRQVIDQKLESLRRCVLRVKAKCPDKVDTLLADADLQDIVTLNLSRAVQLCVDLGAHVIAGLEVPAPGTMGQTFELLSEQGVIDAALAQRLKRAVGFRNIAVHNYDAINWHMVHRIARDHLGDFSDFAAAMVRWVEAEGA